MSDSSRRFLTTSFLCTKCGESMRISSDSEEKPRKQPAQIWVHPCAACFGEAEKVNRLFTEIVSAVAAAQ